MVRKIYNNVPIPFINKQVVGLTLKRNGTSTVAPNIANRCWILSGMLSRSGGRSSTWITLRSMMMTSFLSLNAYIIVKFFWQIGNSSDNFVIEK